MFTNITWSTYFFYVAVIGGGWYLFVAARYYQQEIRAFALRKFVREPELNKPSIASTPSGMPAESVHDTNEDQLVARIDALSLRLEEVVKESASKGYSKEEFMFLLQLTIKEFPELDISRCRAAVKSLVTAECEKEGFLLLREEELNLLWPDIQR
jgi:hypothetical protein